MIRITCPGCGKPQQLRGGAAPRCPDCGLSIILPETEGENPRGPRATWVLAAAGLFVFLGLAGGGYIFFSLVRGKAKPDSPAARNPDPPAIPAPPIAALVQPPVAKLSSDDLYRRFRKDPEGVKREWLNKKLSVVLEKIRWEVEDLQQDANGIIELFVYDKKDGPKLFIRFGESKTKLVSKMRQYADNRKKGDVVNFVITGYLAVKSKDGREFPALDQVTLDEAK